MAFIEPMHRNKPNITYLLTYLAPYLISLYVIRLYTWMLRVRFHQTD